MSIEKVLAGDCGTLDSEMCSIASSKKGEKAKAVAISFSLSVRKLHI